MRLLVDFGPIGVFFVANALAGGSKVQQVMTATAAFMAATAVAMLVSRVKLGRISPMLWLSGLLVLVFGGLTLVFQNDTFIKVKPTIVYLMFAAILGFGIATGRPTLKLLLETAYPGLSERGWRRLSINWAWFFVAMAALNEIVWRTAGWDFWVGFKLWGVMPLTLLFAALNIPMLLRHGLTLDRAKAVEAEATPPGQ